MRLTDRSPAERRRIVRRMFRRLERQHARRFLRSWGKGGERSKLYVSLEAIELAMPWCPGPLGEIRADVDDNTARLNRVEGTVSEHSGKIKRLQEFQRRAAQLIADIANA
jgi:hypothetical protein